MLIHTWSYRSIYRASKHAPDIISTGKNVLTKGQSARHAAHYGTKATNIAKTKVDELLAFSTRAKYNSVKWSKDHLDKFLKHVSDGHSASVNLAARIASGKTGNIVTKFTAEGAQGMQKVMNEAMARMANGDFIMKTDVLYSPYNFIMVTVDMGKTVGKGLGKDGKEFACTAINMIIGPNGNGTMYPIKNAYSGAKKRLDANMVHKIIQGLK
jgi:hypothetical protein